MLGTVYFDIFLDYWNLEWDKQKRRLKNTNVRATNRQVDKENVDFNLTWKSIGKTVSFQRHSKTKLSTLIL